MIANALDIVCTASLAVSRNTAHIVHLCVDESHRGQDVAGTLVRRLREITKDLQGIRLKCRQDYEANKIWPKLHFIAL